MVVRTSLPGDLSAFYRFLQNHSLSLLWSEKEEWIVVDRGQVLPVHGEIRVVFLSRGLERSIATHRGLDLNLPKDARDWRETVADPKMLEKVRDVAVPLVKDFVHGFVSLKVDNGAGIEFEAPRPLPPPPRRPPAGPSGAEAGGLLSRLFRRRPAPVTSEPEKVVRPAPRLAAPSEADAAAIREVVRERGISRLVHFTRAENLGRIRKEGLLPRATLEMAEPQPRFPDALRLDGYRDAICVSIGFPNYKMFYRYSRESKDWAVLEIDPAILWSHPCAFFPKNAATSEFRVRPLADFVSVSALRAMYVDPRPSDLRADYTTDPQAEVLVFGSIESRFITKTVTVDQGTCGLGNDDLFGPRSDWRFWPAKSSQDEGLWP